MLRRCINPNDKRYSDYGGRGIEVCERWQKFENFYEDTKVGYSHELSLDRFPDTNGNYEPTNFRWATVIEQQNNKRSNVVFSYKGFTKTCAEWARFIGIDQRAFFKRRRKDNDIIKTFDFYEKKYNFGDKLIGQCLPPYP